MLKENISIGERIRAVRRGLCLTQDQLAEKSGLSPNYIGQLEREERSPSLKTLTKIAAALGVNPDYLVKVPQSDIETKLHEIRQLAKTPENLDKLVKIARIIFCCEDDEPQ